MTSNEMEAIVSLEKEHFIPNEIININFTIDNSKCNRDVKSEKVKLHREIVIFKGKGKKAPIFSKNSYIEEFKQPVAAKGLTKTDNVLQFKLPSEEKVEKYLTVDDMHPTLQILTKMLSPSQSRGIFMIRYRLDLFVKHKSLMEFGQGNSA